MITNPNVLLAGVIGSGKSSTAKALITKSVALGHKAYLPCDPKAEWTPVTEAMGGTVIKLGPGLPTRLNPVDAGRRPDAVVIDEWDRIVWSRRCALLGTLAESTLGRSLAAIEHTALDLCVRDRLYSGTDSHGPGRRRRPLHARSMAAERAGLEASGLTADGREVALSIRRLVHGGLSGMFDGPSTTEFDPAADGLAGLLDW